MPTTDLEMKMRVTAILIALVMVLPVGCAPAPAALSPAQPPAVPPAAPKPVIPPSVTITPSIPTPAEPATTPNTSAAPPSSPAPPSPAQAPTANPPNIVPAQAPRTIGGARVWLFAIDDGSPKLAVSAESDGQLLVGRLDANDPAASVAWQTAAGPADTGGISIADHWHIYAHGDHWIVFSVAGDSASYLL